MGHAAKVKRARREVRAVAQVFLVAADGGIDPVASWRCDPVGRPSEEGTVCMRRWTPRRQLGKCVELRRAMVAAQVPSPVRQTLHGRDVRRGQPCSLRTMPGWAW